jgi:acyl-CoA thioesterase-1
MLRSAILLFLLTFAAISSANAQIVVLGASSTAGYGVGSAAAFPAQLEAILRANARPMSVVAAGVSGDTTGGMLARLSSAAPPGPDRHPSDRRQRFPEKNERFRCCRKPG